MVQAVNMEMFRETDVMAGRAGQNGNFHVYGVSHSHM
jgi:hypothetical protein